MADDDWLPESAPPEPNPSSNATRTIVIWLVLIVMFVVLYAMFSTDDPQGPSRTGYAGYWIWIAAIVGFFTPIVFIALQFRGHKKFNRAQTAGLEALAQNKPLVAAELFAELARNCRTRPTWHAVARYNYGYALLRAGESARAVGILLRVERTPKLQVGGVKGLVPLAIARAFAIGGDVVKANAWLETARSRSEYDNPVYGRALLASAEILVRCREGKYEEALAVCEENWSILVHHLSVDLMAEPWLMRAFAVAMTSSVRDAAAAEPWLRALRLLPPDQSRWLTLHWPELEQFATTSDVLRARPASPSQPAAPAP